MSALPGDPFRCCVCGVANLRCLCRACRLANTAYGALAPWVAALQREAQRLSKRLTRARRSGVSLESFEDLDAPRLVNR